MLKSVECFLLVAKSQSIRPKKGDLLVKVQWFVCVICHTNKKKTYPKRADLREAG